MRSARSRREWGESYNALKRRWTNTVALLAMAQRLPREVSAAGPVDFAFAWHEPDRKRDPDNVSAAGRKLILDGLVTAGVLVKDGAAHVAGFVGECFVYPGDDDYGGPLVLCSGTTMGGAQFQLRIPHRLPDLNELFAARELGVRRDIARRRSGRP